MSEIIKFGAKSTSGIATAVRCNENGNLITERKWEPSVITLYNGLPTTGLFTDSINIGDKALSSLRIINSTDADIELSLELDYPPVDLYSFGWKIGKPIVPQEGSPFTFDDSTDATKKFVSTPIPVPIGDRNISIKVDDGYTLTAYNVDENGNYTGTYSTTKDGNSRTFTAETIKVFRIAKDEDAVVQTSIYNYLSHLTIGTTGGSHLYNLMTMEQFKITVEASVETRVYTITPADWDILNYLQNIKLGINPKTVPTSGLFTVTLISKR